MTERDESDGRELTERGEGDPRELGEDEVADIEVITGLRAKSLRFEVVPETSVTFGGEPGERSSSTTERENLPDEVEPGVTYRDVGVRWKARSRIDHPTDPEHADGREAEGEQPDR